MEEKLEVSGNKVKIIKTETVDAKIHLATLKSNLKHFEDRVAETQAKIKQIEDGGIKVDK